VLNIFYLFYVYFYCLLSDVFCVMSLTVCVYILQLDASKNLTSQCVQGCGLVQVNVEIKTILGGSPRINITDVLKPADEDDEEDLKPDVGKCRALLYPYRLRFGCPALTVRVHFR